MKGWNLPTFFMEIAKPWWWDHHALSKCRVSISQSGGVTSQKNEDLNRTLAKAYNLAFILV